MISVSSTAATASVLKRHGIGAEAPAPTVGQPQHDAAAALCRQRGDAGIKMEPYGKGQPDAGRTRGGGFKAVLPLQAVAVRCQRQDTPVPQAIAAQIAVMSRFQPQPGLRFAARDLDPLDPAPERAALAHLGGIGVIEDQGGMRRRHAGQMSQRLAIARIDDDPDIALGQFERQRSGMRAARAGGVIGRHDVEQHETATPRHAHETRVARGFHRLAARRGRLENARRHAVRFIAGAIDMGQPAIGMPERAQERRHAIKPDLHAGGAWLLTHLIGGAHRDQQHHDAHDIGGQPADHTAIGKHRLVQRAFQQRLAALQPVIAMRQQQPGQHQPGRRFDPLRPGLGVAGHPGQMPRLPGHGGQHGAAIDEVVAGQRQRRMQQPELQPARGHRRRPGRTLPVAVALEPAPDQRFRQGAGAPFVMEAAKVAQPSETGRRGGQLGRCRDPAPEIGTLHINALAGQQHIAVHSRKR